MKIPDGVRDISFVNNNGLTAAAVYPMTFPSPGDSQSVLAWLTFCPHPALPLIDGKKMRRMLFSVPPIGSMVSDAFNHPQNEGHYTVSYLKPGVVFLSELNITNNGVSFDMGRNYEIEAKPYPAPGDKGFLDFRFEVLEMTNYNGIAFPLRTVLKRFYPDWHTKIPDDLYMSCVSELIVKRVSFAASDLAHRKPAPAELMAEDYRPPNLPPNRGVNYMVTNDVWRPVSDPNIQAQAQRLIDPYGIETVDNDLNSKANQKKRRKASSD